MVLSSAVQFKFLLDSSSLSLVSAPQPRAGGSGRSEPATLLQLEGRGSRFTLLSRPTSMLAGVQLQSMGLVEHVTQDSKYRDIVARQQPAAAASASGSAPASKDAAPLVDVSFESAPLDGSADYKLVANVQAVDVVLNREVRTFCSLAWL